MSVGGMDKPDSQVFVGLGVGEPLPLLVGCLCIFFSFGGHEV